MHMWMWFGYDLGEFLFPGLNIVTRWSFALTWIVLFFVSVLFEGSKVYLARLQRAAQKKLYPFRSDERRNLLCERDQAGIMEPTTSRNTSSGEVSRWSSLKVRFLVNIHQSAVFIIHNTVGYILMLAVMIYNVHLLLAVVFGMMLGHFLFGTKLTQLQMQCFSTKRVIICTPECDDTAENTTPPLLDSSVDSETDLLSCQTRTCIQPSHYFPANSQGGSGESSTTCYYGAKKCASKVARAKKMQHAAGLCDSGSPTIEDSQLLAPERPGCCKKKDEPPPVEKKCCGKKSSQVTVSVHIKPSTSKTCCSKNQSVQSDEVSHAESREESPPVSCCHNLKTSSESQEQIV